MKIFLDVGGHTGQTLKEVTKERYKFDKIFCFEPSIKCYEKLKRKFKQDNVYIENIGLSNKNTFTELYRSGSKGASIYKDKHTRFYKRETNKYNFERIRLVKANEWISENLNSDDIIFMKLNCEGSECDIIENLIENNSYDIIDHIVIDFDVEKIPSQKHRKSVIRKLIKNKKNIINKKKVKKRMSKLNKRRGNKNKIIDHGEYIAFWIKKATSK